MMCSVAKTLKRIKTEKKVLRVIFSMLIIMAAALYICSTMENKSAIPFTAILDVYMDLRTFLTALQVPWAMRFRGWKPAFTTNHYDFKKKIPMT